jgi:hypothetical protein
VPICTRPHALNHLVCYKTDSVTCGLSDEQYRTLSEAKIAVARFHLTEVERLVATSASGSFIVDPDAGTPLHGHADGAIFETFAAFDTFSCAVAHRLAFKGAEKFSMTKLAADGRVSNLLRRRVANTIATDRWMRLDWLRNLAGHRGVVSQFMRWGEHLGGMKVHVPDPDHPSQRGEEFLPLMTDLLAWSEVRLRFLVNGAGFSPPPRVVRLRGGEIRIEVQRAP